MTIAPATVRWTARETETSAAWEMASAAARKHVAAAAPSTSGRARTRASRPSAANVGAALSAGSTSGHLAERPDEGAERHRETEPGGLYRQREPTTHERDRQAGDHRRQGHRGEDEARQCGDHDDRGGPGGERTQDRATVVVPTEGHREQGHGDRAEEAEHERQRHLVEAERGQRSDCDATAGDADREPVAWRGHQGGECEGAHGGEEQQRVQGLVDRRQAHGGVLGPRLADGRDASGTARDEGESRSQHRQGTGGEGHPRDGVPRRRRDRRDRGPHEGHTDRERGLLVGGAVEAGQHDREREGARDQRRTALPHERLGPGDGPQQHREGAHQDELPAVAVEPQLARRRVRRCLGQCPHGAACPGRGGHETRHPGQHLRTEASADGSQSRKCEHGHETDQVDGGDGVGRPVDARQDHRETHRSDQLRHHETGRTQRRHRHDDAGHEEAETDQADEGLDVEVAEPAGVVGADEVEHHESERDGGQRLGGDREAAATKGHARRAGGTGQQDKDGGAASHPEPGPGDGQEDHGGDEEAGGAESEQDLGDRCAPEAVPDGCGPRDGHRREVRVEGRRRGRRWDRRGEGRGPQPVEQVVGLAQRAEQLGGKEALQRQRARRASERRGGERAAAVGTDGRVRVARSSGHVTSAGVPRTVAKRFWLQLLLGRGAQPVVSIRAHEALLSTRNECANQRGPARVLHLRRHRDRRTGAGEVRDPLHRSVSRRGSRADVLRRADPRAHRRDLGGAGGHGSLDGDAQPSAASGPSVR